MESVILKPLYHREQECIGIYFEKNAQLQFLIQKKAEAKWSKTQKCWYALLSKNNYEKLAKALHGKAELKVDELKKYLLDKKKGAITSAAPKTTLGKPENTVNISKASMNIKSPQFSYRLSKENE
jgi:hypothetical protein